MSICSSPSTSAPLLARTVPVDLDPVAIGIVEVEGLADQVVRSAREPPTGVGHPAQRTGEVRSAGEQDRQVEEAGGAVWPARRVGPAHELDDGGLAVRAEAHRIRIPIERPKPQRLLVKALGAIEVGDGRRTAPRRI